tara:strand:+ start:276 stop:1010 length:735 start_codon:yes stop_codon:yes gene_type:complete
VLKVSIITVCYNSSKTIYKTLESVRNQKFKNFEHIIIDGKSTDNTLEICSSFSHIKKIISEKDNGVYDAFNKGIACAEGDIIGFLNSDDVYYNNKSLDLIVQNFNHNIDCVFGNLLYINYKGEVVRRWKSKTFKKGAFKKAWMPAHPTFYCRKEIYDRFGGYKTKYIIAGDFELMLRFLERKQIRSKFIYKPIIKMLSGGISNEGIISKIKILKEEFEAFKENKMDVNKLFYIFHKVGKIREFF